MAVDLSVPQTLPLPMAQPWASLSVSLSASVLPPSSVVLRTEGNGSRRGVEVAAGPAVQGRRGSLGTARGPGSPEETAAQSR